MEPEDLEYAARGLSRRGFVMGTAGAAALLAIYPDLVSPSDANALTNPFDELWNPWDGYLLNRSWADHVDLGGLDYNVSQGSLMRAPHSGAVSTVHTNSCGNELRITHSSGWKSVFFHLHGYVVTSGTVAMGDYIAYSGGRRNPGPGESESVLTYESGTQSGGAHVHWHLQDTTGARKDPTLYVNHSGPGGLPLPPAATMEELMSTDILYYADRTLPGATTQGLKSPVTTVSPDSLWYQECVGAPLFKVSNTTVTSPNNMSNNVLLEYEAFQGIRATPSATRWSTSAARIAALIDLRGEATAPIAALAPLRTT